MPLSFSIFSRLTSLNIVNSYDNRKDPFEEALAELLNGLEGMRELERLQIYFCNANEYFPVAEEPVRKHRSVTLAKLAYLELNTSLREATMLISHLSLPAYAVTCYRLTVSAEDHPDRFFPRILASVQFHANPAQISNTITSLHVGTVEVLTRARPYYETVITARTNAHTHEPAMTVQIFKHACPARVVFNALASAHLRELTLDCDVIKDSTWPDLPALRRLVVKSAAVGSLCESLGRVPPVMPALEALVFVGVVISVSARQRWAQGEGMRELPRILAARAEAGCRLEELDVTRCIVDEEWVVRAKKKLFGTRVKWEKDA
ncbi:hypothetical protein FA95DRAFT_694164 [Auriscalpium vulgare]|uniref:Uncharacterized protein n=1 Tax=Auriscalpium vulgare TaxID=40419 RepID=A0ACB8RC40_9AGAM|nr:hypothetical protein FA95DRAFT_694164 [Auriscalpium vulgare]